MSNLINQIRCRAAIFRIPLMVVLGTLYFSFNTYYLPHGLSVLILAGLACIPYVFLVNQYYRLVFAGISALAVCHFILGANLIFYGRSLVLLLAFIALFFVLVGFLKTEPKRYRWMVFFTVFNLVFLAIFLVIKYTPFQDMVWWTFFLSYSVGSYTRLKGLTYEPSYYAFMLTPLFLYYTHLLFNYRFRFTHVLLLGGLSIGFYLSFSLGVIMGLIASLGITSIYFLARPVFVKRNRWPLVISLASAIVSVASIFAFLPQSPLVARLQDLIYGRDISANSRLFDSFRLSYRLLDGMHFFVGLGPGQLKWMGYNEIKEYYHYFYMDIWAPAMPNSVTDWLCTFGLLGLLLKLGLESYFFLKLRVYSDFFRMSCFVFMFIYQFTGGYLFSVPELILWALAFTKPKPGIHKNWAR